jgi:hypothetical protein
VAEILERTQEGVLDDVLCVGGASRPRWQPPTGPPLQGQEVPREQCVEGGPVAGLGALEEVERRFGVHAQPILQSGILCRCVIGRHREDFLCAGHRLCQFSS